MNNPVKRQHGQLLMDHSVSILILIGTRSILFASFYSSDNYLFLFFWCIVLLATGAGFSADSGTSWGRRIEDASCSLNPKLLILLLVSFFLFFGIYFYSCKCRLSCGTLLLYSLRVLIACVYYPIAYSLNDPLLLFFISYLIISFNIYNLSTKILVSTLSPILVYYQPVLVLCSTSSFLLPLILIFVTMLLIPFYLYHSRYPSLS